MKFEILPKNISLIFYFQAVHIKANPSCYNFCTQSKYMQQHGQCVQPTN